VSGLFKQLGSMLGVSFAAVCCLGVSWALAAAGGLFIAPAVVYAGLAAMVGGSLWDFALLRAFDRPDELGEFR
jgi:hypothetical protein